MMNMKLLSTDENKMIKSNRYFPNNSNYLK